MAKIVNGLVHSNVQCRYCNAQATWYMNGIPHCSSEACCNRVYRNKLELNPVDEGKSRMKK